VEGVPLEFGL